MKSYINKPDILKRYTNNILLIIRITTVILMVSMFQVSASSVAKEVNYVRAEASLIQIFNEIKNQTGYSVIWSETKIDVTTTIDANFKKATIQDVLNKCIGNFSLSYLIDDKMVMIKEDKLSFREKLANLFSSIDVKGRVVDENNAPLVGAVVKVKGTQQAISTNDNGEFVLNNVNESSILAISHMGYEPQEIPASKHIGTVRLQLKTDKLEEVEIVSTGYQDIPKERATGSFTQINNETLNRNVGTNILDRLEGVASGLILNRGLGSISNTASTSKISIRGRSTLFANAEPLIVLDGFPYDGNIDQINPADISTITMLKDAAAASIWGSKSGNGVIVINTKRGYNSQKLTLELTSTLTIGNRQNLNYLPQISSSDYIDLEQYLFGKGNFDYAISTNYMPISSAVEIMNAKRKGEISQIDSINQINTLKQFDIRSDLQSYINRPNIYQQYQMNVSGGSDFSRFYISGGYDRNQENKVGHNYDRMNLRANNTISVIKNKLDLTGDVAFSTSNTKSIANNFNPYRPYDRMADEHGNSLAVVNLTGLRVAYLDTAGKGKLLDWQYRPKNELSADNTNILTQYKINVGLNYKVSSGLNLAVNYQYLKENLDGKFDGDLTKFYTRNIINTYSSIVNNDVIRTIPLGSILNKTTNSLSSKIFRSQLNFHKNIARNHEITAIVGYEGSDARNNLFNVILYGYDPETDLNRNNNVDPLNYYPLYYQPFATSQIATAPNQANQININQSYYGNASYSFKKRYVLSGSLRRDESNLFGVKTNQKGVPLWSAGFAWNLNQEGFYQIQWLPKLKLRLTYGYSGNIDKSVSGYLTARSTGFVNQWGEPTIEIANPPNPSLRWEKVKIWNLGLDYEVLNNRLVGSIDVYNKNSVDLIGNNPISMQTGILQFKGNGASYRTKGLDFVLNSKNIVTNFSWETSLLFNFNADKVTNYKIKQSSNLNIINRNYNNPLESYPYYSIFSFPSVGLDVVGDPQGFLNGTISKDYSVISSTLDPTQIKYHGSGSPKYYGSIINSFGYKRLELSFNLSYKLDYYFRRSSIFSGSNYNSPYQQLVDFDKQWKTPGDEKSTRIPALVYPSDISRDSFFQYSEDLVEKGDHIRLQDVRLAFSFPARFVSKMQVRSLSLFMYAKNFGIIWRENKLNLDPDYGTTAIPQPFSMSFGVNVNL